MLYLIGLGLGWKDMSLKALEKIQKCDLIYLEAYTSVSDYSITNLEKLLKRKIVILDREKVEQGREYLVRAKSKDVALLIYGDPLSATTHLEILEDCRKKRIKCEIVHAPSVFTAVAETGLQLYKFGKVASIPFWEENFKPESFFDIFEQNRKIGAHTLFLLDLRPKEKKYLRVKEAVETLLIVSKKRGASFDSKTFCVGCARLGTTKTKIVSGTARKVANAKYGAAPYCLIVPAGMHFTEREFLEGFK